MRTLRLLVLTVSTMGCARSGGHASDNLGDDGGATEVPATQAWAVSSGANTGSSGSSGSGSGQGPFGWIPLAQLDAGDAGRLTRCDDAGRCSCINIASVGREGVWGPNCIMGDTTAFFDWLIRCRMACWSEVAWPQTGPKTKNAESAVWPNSA